MAYHCDNCAAFVGEDDLKCTNFIIRDFEEAKKDCGKALTIISENSGEMAYLADKYSRCGCESFHRLEAGKMR